MNDLRWVAGTNPQRVIDLLEQRRAVPPHDFALDKRKIGLVVEGGSMRGVLSAGSLLAVDLLGFRDCFDAVYAVSAGSVNAAYFLSGQGVAGITVYFDDISSRRFINPWRFWKIVDIDYVYDHIVPHKKPLDEAAILRSRQSFYVTATDTDSGKSVLLDTKTGDAPITRFLKASSALPVLYNRGVEVAGKHYMDGGVSAGLPLDLAIAQGCTDLLVLLSKPVGYVGKAPSPFEKLVFRIVTGLRHPAMYRAYMGAFQNKESNRRLAIGSRQLSGINVATFCPDSEESNLDRTTIARALLVQGAYTMARKVYRAFGEDTAHLGELFSTFLAERLQ
jgi:predicted patatin/cPLA2 family phospholipase